MLFAFYFTETDSPILSEDQGVNNHFGGSLNLTSHGLNLTLQKLDLTKTILK